MTETAHCSKHGDTTLWIVCSHVAGGSAETVIFSENEDGLCFDCAHNLETLREEDVALMCSECLKDFAAKLMIDAGTYANLKERVLGLSHLSGDGPKKPQSGQE